MSENIERVIGSKLFGLPIAPSQKKCKRVRDKEDLESPSNPEATPPCQTSNSKVTTRSVVQKRLAFAAPSGAKANIDSSHQKPKVSLKNKSRGKLILEIDDDKDDTISKPSFIKLNGKPIHKIDFVLRNADLSPIVAKNMWTDQDMTLLSTHNASFKRRTIVGLDMKVHAVTNSSLVLYLTPLDFLPLLINLNYLNNGLPFWLPIDCPLWGWPTSR